MDLVMLLQWLDSDNAKHDPRASAAGEPRTELDRWFPFVFLHAGCFLVLVTGWSPISVATCAWLYFVRMFAVTGFYHRYFSHRTFKTSRIAQFVFAVVGLSAVQRGPLWWAAHHRVHHQRSDMPGDVHSPVQRGFWWSHLGWITSSKNMPTDYDRVRDFAQFPELRHLNRFDWSVPLLLFVCLFIAGETLGERAQTSGLQMVVWGFFISTTILFHATASINSLSHMFGYQSFETNDASRNNALLALLTLGEGWHNNHHRYMHSVRQGFLWWQYDITFYLLWIMAKLRIVWDLNPVPSSVLAEPDRLGGVDP